MSASLFGGPSDVDAQLQPSSSPELPKPADPNVSSASPSAYVPDIADSDASEFLPDRLSSSSPDQSAPNDARQPFQTGATAVAWPDRAAKYKRLIRRERELLTAVEQTENDDLAAHLYNAHAIHRAARASVSAEERNEQLALRPRHSKRRWLRRDAWVPASRWTAWPLRPERVPAEGQSWRPPLSGRFDAPGGVARRRVKVSDELEEGLIVAMQRRARGELGIFRNGLEEVNRDVKMAAQASGGESGDRKYRRMKASQTPTGFAKVKRSSSHLDASADEKGQEEQCDVDEDFTPAPIADDEHAERLLRPSAREILSRMDRLLLALDRSRQTQRRERSRSTSRSVSRGRGRSRSSGSHRSLSKTDVESSVSGSDEAGRSERSRPLRERDWSEVLGMASLIGWDASAVEAARKRCSALFDESFELHTLKETANQPKSRSAPESAKPSTPIREATPPTLGWLCAEPECAAAAFDTRFDLSRHLRTVHGLTQQTATQRLNKAYGPSGRYVCPERQCPRSHPTKPFKRRDRWLEHIRRAHGYDYTGAELVVLHRPPPPADDDRDANGNFRCPDADCARHGWGFAQRWRLADHLRKRHGVRTSSQRGRGRSSSRDAGVPSSDALSAVESDWTTDADFDVPVPRMHGGVHVDGYLEPVRLPSDDDDGVDDSDDDDQ